MFEFLKALFKKELEKQEIRVNEVDGWFDNKTKEQFNVINQEISVNLNEIKEVLEGLKEHLKVLEEAEIKDAKKIQDKIKHIVISHRTSYIRILMHFINSIEFPTEINYKEGERISYDIDEGLDEIAKTTVKSYQATQHLFSDTLLPVTKDLKQMANLSRKIKDDIKQNKIIEIDKIKDDINELNDLIRKKKNMSLQLGENGGILLRLENQKQKFEERKKELVEGGDFTRLGEAKNELKEIDEQLSRLRQSVVELFSPLETGLKKFSRITLDDEKLVEKYAKSAFDALLGDKELKIVGILSRMEQSIMGGSIDLRGHKKDKTLGSIQEINSDKLKRSLADYRELFNKKDYVMQRIGKNPVKSQLKEMEYNQEHNDFKLKKLKEDIGILEKKFSQIDLEENKKKLEEKIKEIIKIDLIISLA